MNVFVSSHSLSTTDAVSLVRVFDTHSFSHGDLKEKTLQCCALSGVLFSLAPGSLLPALLKSYSGEKIALTLTSFGQGGLPLGDLKEKTLQCCALSGVLFSLAPGSKLPALLKIKPRCLRTRVFSFVGVRRFYFMAIWLIINYRFSTTVDKILHFSIGNL